MIKKRHTIKTNEYIKTRVIFRTVCRIYFAGLFAGCVFTVKNSHNMNFVKAISFTGFLSDSQNTGDLSRYIQFFTRDILCITSVFILSNSGIIKGLFICIPFFRAIQNSCITTADIICQNSIVNIISGYILRTTATNFILIIFCTQTAKNIINGREYSVENIKKFIIYPVSIIIIFVIDYTIKNMF